MKRRKRKLRIQSHVRNRKKKAKKTAPRDTQEPEAAAEPSHVSAAAAAPESKKRKKRSAAAVSDAAPAPEPALSSASAPKASASPAPSRRRRPAKPADTRGDVEASQRLPGTKQARMEAILGFMRGTANLKDEEAKVLLRGRLDHFKSCRMNVYYGRPAVGLTCRAEGRDFAYFYASNNECPMKYRLAATMKGAEMLVTFMH